MKIRYQEKHKKIFLRLSILLYLISLTQVGFYEGVNRNDGEIGITLVLIGIFGLDDGTAIIWLANPILWYAWGNFKNLKPTLIASILSTLISIAFLFFEGYMRAGVGIDYQQVSTYIEITGYALGYYLWLLSSVILLAGNTIRKVNGEPLTIQPESEINTNE